MAVETIRTHIVIPKELMESVDELVGRRYRSKFFTEAVEEKLARAASKVVGSLADISIPGWESSKSAAEWVRASRRGDEARLKHRAGRS